MRTDPKYLRKKFWEEDIKNGGYIFNQYNEIRKVIYDEDVEWVEDRFKEIKQYAIENAEFYKNYKIDNIPSVNKTDILNNYSLFQSKGKYLSPVHQSSTSGSTGIPFTVNQDHVKRMRNIADLKVIGEWCNYQSHERMIFFRVINDKLHRTKEQEDNENIYYIDSANLDNEHLDFMIKSIIEKEPKIVFSYSSTLVELGKYVLKHYKKTKFSIETVLTGGEGISEENRLMLKKAFNCNVYRRYSDMELGILGQDNGDGKEYRLNWGSYYFEILEKDSDSPARLGEPGRIVITDLFNRAMPMIRYDTGDIGIMDHKEGYRFPVLTEIWGRSRDCIYDADGNLISPAKISVMLWGVKGIKQWQFIQDDQYDYTFKVNCSDEFVSDRILDKFKKLLGEKAHINIVYVNDIPVLASNKRRAVICNYKKEK